jgi:tRNA pseudouridine38-40 synthase
MTVRYQMKLAYDGTEFQGFQRQKDVRTVQSVLETALRQLNWDGFSILAAGRTDSGVHATGQVVAFDLKWDHGCEALQRAVNAYLPPDVSSQAVCVAPAEFHPRFDATWRRYNYSIYIAEQRQPLRDRYAWRIWPSLDLNVLNETARLLVGQHDFAAFGRPNEPNGATERIVFEALWTGSGDGMEFMVRANAFLYHMVRRMVFSQLFVAQGRLNLTDFANGVNKAQVFKPGISPPNGLVLSEVGYSFDK